MINKYKKFMLKVFFPSVIIYIVFLGYIYFYTNNFSIQFEDLLFFSILNFLVSLFWGLLGEFQNLTGDFLKSNLTTKIIFIIAILGIFYLYKITGKI